LSPALHILFSRRARVVTAEQYDRWCEANILRILGVPGVAAAARYELVPALDDPPEPDRFATAAIFQVETTSPEVMAALAAGISGGTGQPDWLAEIPASSWLAYPLGERIERQETGERMQPRGTGSDSLAQSLQLVFSDAGDADHPVSDQSFDGWYEQHLDEILSIPGFTSAQRYRLEEVTRPANGTIPGRRLCVYTTTKPPDELRAEMDRMNLLSADSYSRLKDSDATGPALPEWWDRVRFASWNLIPR
jgi:hypothetical protein